MNVGEITKMLSIIESDNIILKHIYIKIFNIITNVKFEKISDNTIYCLSCHRVMHTQKDLINHLYKHVKEKLIEELQ
jgi:hypothetical protein